jgi:putative toxin-antitoxin system antitoxin component (TIGR02293 family)
MSAHEPFTYASELAARGLLREAATLDLAEIAESGVLPDAVESLISSGVLTRDESYRLIAPRRTYEGRLQRGDRLSTTESERVLRIARVAVQAESILGTEAAAAWLRGPSLALGGRVPLDLLATEPGGRAVEDELARIDYGVYA